MTPNIPITRAIDLSVPLVASKSKHRDYDRVVKLAKDYKMLITGENMDELYRRYDRRESQKDLEQAIRITNPLTPAICNALTNPLRKLANVPAKINFIQYEGDPERKKAAVLNAIIDGFNGGNDLDSLFGEVFLDYGVQDPNGFVLYTFENYDNRFEKAEVFATVQPSCDVYNFEYHGGILQWLFLHKTIKYQTAPATQAMPANYAEGDRFIFYTAENHIVYTQILKPNLSVYTENVLVDSGNVQVTSPSMYNGESNTIYYLNTKEALYEVTFYAQKSGRVPAFRLGFNRDNETNGRTMVNLWHAAMPYLLKNVKSVREMDLSFVLHTFLQRIEYKSPCSSCNGGKDPIGGDCEVCKGTGKNTFSSAQDSIELDLPVRPDPAMLIDLSKLVHYVSLPTDILKIQMENVQSQITGAFRAVYNSDMFVVDTTADTATGKKIDMQSVYDTLQPASMWYSSARMESVYIIATYKDLQKGLIAIHRFPRDFHYESQDQLLERITKAKGVVSNGLLAYWQNSLVDLALVDDPFQAERVKTMTRLDPFLGKSDDIVVTIMSQGLTTKRNKVLYSNLPYILDRAEASTTGGVVFYDLTREKQDEKINKIVDSMIEEMDEAASQAVQQVTLGADPDQEEQNRTADDGQGTEDPVPGAGQGS